MAERVKRLAPLQLWDEFECFTTACSDWYYLAVLGLQLVQAGALEHLFICFST